MKQVVFFDGVCNLCNGFVDFLMKRDRARKFQVASLQGATAKKLLPGEMVKDLHTMALWREGEILKRSDAVLATVSQLGGLWFLARLGWLVPRFLRDAVYGFVVKRRYDWWGKRNTCRLPTKEEREQFLD
ncbi:MAG TPA: DCC1-like thiol-disulfide oxidoreductase family protein [Bdellovibrionota bacterium]|jgi:predicted DCC family thiol-disulfide oxidoreductase YuxK